MILMICTSPKCHIWTLQHPWGHLILTFFPPLYLTHSFKIKIFFSCTALYSVPYMTLWHWYLAALVMSRACFWVGVFDAAFSVSVLQAKFHPHGDWSRENYENVTNTWPFLTKQKLPLVQEWTEPVNKTSWLSQRVRYRYVIGKDCSFFFF